ncbi:MAG: translocation/assembly module TamB [Cyclobacteriaceae bacterium]|nr:translocation/assembly module TamB [Cyclobacteriaceae bacterium]
MKLQVIKNKILYGVRVLLIYTAYITVFLLFASFFILQIPAVQTRIARSLLASVNEQTGFYASIKRIEIFWFDRIRITDLKLTDPEGNDLFDIRSLRINFSFSGLFRGKNFALDAVLLDSAKVHLATIRENDTLRNLNINVLVHRLSSGPSNPGARAPVINLGEVILKSGMFIYETDRDSIKNGFDYNHFQIAIEDAEIQQMLIQDDTVSFHVMSLQANELGTGFTIHELRTFFRFSDYGLEFPGIYMRAGNSVIADTVLFRYSGQNDLDNFIDSVYADIHFKDAIIHPADLALFAPGAEILKQPFYLSGKARGKISDFKLNEMDLRVGNTRLAGSLSMEGLPDIDETFIVADLAYSTLDLNDLSFLFNEKTTNQLNNLGLVKFQGQFLGYPNDFVANGSFSGRIGNIRSDINLKINETNPGLSSYSGKLILTDFNLGLFFEDTTLFQKVSMEGKINGKGLTLETADFYLNGNIGKLGIYGYTYSGINTNARFSNQFFVGSLSVKDPNLALQINGTIDLRNQIDHVQLQGRLDSVNLEKLNLSQVPVHISSDIDVDFFGLTLDSLRGRADLKNLEIFYTDEKMHFGQVGLLAARENGTRELRLNTSLLNAEASGDFYFSDLFRDTDMLFLEFLMIIQNDREKLTNYYKQKKSTPKEYEASFKINIKNLNPLFNLLDVPAFINRNTSITGSFSHGQLVTFRAFTHADSLQYENASFWKNELEISASKHYNSTDALAMVYFKSGKQELGKNLSTEELTAEAIWNGNHVAIDLGISEPPENKIELSATVDFEDSTYIHLNPSAITLLNTSWKFNSDNRIALLGREWSIHNLILQHQSQSIRLNGHLSADSSRSLSLQAADVSLQMFSGLAGRKLEGILNGSITLANIYAKASVQNTIRIDKLSVNNFLIGNITGNNQWNADTKVFELEFFIDRLGNRIVNFTGFYNPSDTISPINGTAQLNQANLKIIEPFLEELFSQIQGTATGSCSITGTLNNPLLSGSARIDNGALMINYLKTSYRFNGTIQVTPTSIVFRDFNLTDGLNNPARLQGEITHRAFGDMHLNLFTTFTDLQVLNTTARDNELFYGQAYASGQATIKGPVNNLSLTVDAITRKNTRFFIPIGGTTVSEQKDFIRFINFSDSTQQEDISEGESKKIALTGFNMEFNLEVTPDAYSEIIFDIKAGDIIRGRGNGKLKLQMNTDGEFTMFGPIEFTEGWYNFTLQNIINKEFQIKPGSRITWYGDPYQAVLNINASYNQLASLAPILTDPTLANSTALKRKYPVEVLLKLEGPMMSPQYNFDIEARDLPKSVPIEGRPPVALDLEFYSFKNRMDEQELKKQVFSLIVLRRFTPPESFSMSGSVTNSVSELLSNQLSYWMSQVDENLEIDVNLGAMDQQAFNTFQLRLSYTLLNGRMRITGDGTFNNQNVPATGQGGQPGTFSSLAGDWTVEYLLTPDGKFKVKMYSRTNVNQNTASLTNQNTITTGVSLSYTQNFNVIKDLLRSAHERSRQQAASEPPDSSARKEEEDE